MTAPATSSTQALKPDQVAAFHRDGYLVLRDRVPGDLLEALRQVAVDHLAARQAPFELEAEVQYPGAPASVQADGGHTLRRLLQAWDRHAVFQRWAAHPAATGPLARLLGRPLFLSRCHHNCVMTKMPQFSSLTGWHRDVRYWSFSDRTLINTWLALGPENDDNGNLRIIPGSHTLNLGRDHYDEALFLRTDLPQNQALIDTAVNVELAPGDLLLFHAAAFHAAGRNRTDRAKLAVVMTYHGLETVPEAGSRSARLPEIDVTPA